MSTTQDKARPARSRGALVMAGSVWAVAWSLAVLAVLLAWVADLPAEPLPGIFLSEASPQIRTRADDIDVTVALIYGPVAALVLARGPHPVGIVVALHAIGSAVAALGLQYGLLGREHDLPLWGLLAYAGGWAFVPGTFMIAALPFLLTQERPPPWHRAVVATCAGFAAIALLASMTQQGDELPHNPLAIDLAAYQDALPGVYTSLSFLALLISIASCGVLVSRARRGEAARVGLLWLACGQALLTASYLVQAVPEDAGLPAAVLDFGLTTPVLGHIVYPAAIVVVALGQRLWGVDLAVSRILLWSLLSFFGVLLYLLAVAVVPVALIDGDSTSLIVPVLVALAVLPLRGWLQRRIDRLVYGAGADSEQLLARLGDRIGALPPGSDGLDELAATLRHVLRLGWVEIETGSLLAESGTRSGGRITVVPLTGRSPGMLRVQAVPGLEIDRRTRVVLDGVAGLVAAAGGLIGSYLVLDDARRDLLARRADERRAIRRELHDGLGPALAGVSFGLAAVENLAADRPDEARTLLRELADDVHRRVSQVRDLARSVRAPDIDGDDLADELVRLAERFEAPDRPVQVEVSGLERLPSAVAYACYLIGAEALANAARHSGARRIQVRIAVHGFAEDAAAVLEVSDDGTGIAGTATPGIGLTSMREWAETLGGTLDVSTGPTGTRVRANLPAGDELLTSSVAGAAPMRTTLENR